MKDRYSIGEVARRSNVSAKTLRYYDKIGMLCPEYRDADTNYRYYSKRQLTTLAVIRRYRSMDFCLKEIQALLSGLPLGEIEEKIARHQQEITEEMARLQEKEEACRTLLSQIRKGADVREKAASLANDKYDIHIEEIPPGIMFYTRKMMKNYQNTTVNLDRWMEIFDNCHALQYHITSPVIITYHDNLLEHFLMQDTDVEFGVLIDKEPNIEPGLTDRVRRWGGYRAAVTHHTGNFSGIVNAHIQTIQWVHQNDYEVAGPISDEFVISPLDVDNDDLHVTKVIVPISRKKKKGREKKHDK